MTVGSVFVFGFMFINYRFAVTSIEKASVQIIKADHLARGRKYVVVNYKGDEKDIFFDPSIEVKGYNYVNLSIKQGAFEFDIVIKKELHN